MIYPTPKGFVNEFFIFLVTQKNTFHGSCHEEKEICKAKCALNVAYADDWLLLSRVDCMVFKSILKCAKNHSYLLGILNLLSIIPITK